MEDAPHGCPPRAQGDDDRPRVRPLGAGPLLGYFLREAATNEPEFLMVPRAVNSLTDRVTKALRQVQKELRKAVQTEAVDSL